MATTTTNYGFDIPQSTDLVKDGATAIATLGQDIDTAMNTALGTKKAGMVLLNTTSFSGVSSQSINDVFSATYQNYLILLNIDTVAASNEVSFRMRVGGADNTSANYKWQKATIQSGGAYTGTGSGGALDTLMNVASISGTYTAPVIINIFNPFATDNTSVLSQSTYFDALSNHATTYAGGQTSVTTSYTGFTFFSSTFSGTVRVYGYTN